MLYSYTIFTQYVSTPLFTKNVTWSVHPCLIFKQLLNACAYICGQLYLWLTVENPDLCISMYIYVRVRGGGPCMAGGWLTIMS